MSSLSGFQVVMSLKLCLYIQNYLQNIHLQKNITENPENSMWWVWEQHDFFFFFRRFKNSNTNYNEMWLPVTIQNISTQKCIDFFFLFLISLLLMNKTKGDCEFLLHLEIKCPHVVWEPLYCILYLGMFLLYGIKSLYEQHLFCIDTKDSFSGLPRLQLTHGVITSTSCLVAETKPALVLPRPPHPMASSWHRQSGLERNQTSQWARECGSKCYFCM